MVLYDDEAHDAFWFSDTGMRAKTKDYRKKLDQALESHIFKKPKDENGNILPGTTKHPWIERAVDAEWRLKIFELGENQHHVARVSPQFVTVPEFKSYWENMLNKNSTENWHRRLVILESLDARLAEVLGVELDIPPEFFLAHCDTFTDLSVVDRSYAKQSSSTYWRVPIPQRKSFKAESIRSNPGMRITAGAFDRIPVIQNESADYYSFVSYWGKTDGEDSWTTLLLVDPPGSEIYIGPEQKLFQLGNWMPENRDLCHEVILGSNVKKSQSYGRSIYDALIEMHQLSLPAHTKDPFSSTCFARNFIRAVWEERIIRNEWDVFDDLATDQWNHFNWLLNTSQEAEIPDDQGNEKLREFQILMTHRQNIPLQIRQLRSIMWKFHCEDTPQALLAQDIQESQSIIEERRGWKILEEKLQAMGATLGYHLEMYSQRAAMEEAYSAARQTRAANRMARSSGQLTKIATTIVPCTFVASIFSMGGDFAVGERHFYLYWVISVPITIALLAWVLYEDVIKVIQKSLKGVTAIRQKVVRWAKSEKTTLVTESKFSPAPAPESTSPELFIVRRPSPQKGRSSTSIV